MWGWVVGGSWLWLESPVETHSIFVVFFFFFFFFFFACVVVFVRLGVGGKLLI